MKGPTPRRLWKYVCERLRLRRYLERPGDGRVRPQIPATDLLWALLIGQVLRECSFHGLEVLVRSAARRALGISRQFSDDSLGYFTERLAPAPLRRALAETVKLAKRNKAFAGSGWIGLALDGTKAARSRQARCALCQPIRDAQDRVTGWRHQFCLLSVVGAGVPLPVDVEPYGPGDSEYAAGQRLLARVIGQVGRRFADYVVVDGEFATAPFVHLAGDLGLRVVARLKGNLPALWAAAQARFEVQPPHRTVQIGQDRVELWDADDLDPWEALRWKTVRGLRYRQHKPDGTVHDAHWLTDFTPQEVLSPTLYRMAKSRWEIENQGFNDGKCRYGMEHLCHHHANSVLIGWLVAILAMTIERLYRLRYLHRGDHPLRSAIDVVRRLRVSLGAPPVWDSS